MPTTDVTEAGQSQLRAQYALIQQNWPSLGLTGAPPSFEQWRGINTILNRSDITLAESQDDIRLFNGLESLVTHMGLHNFSFAHIETEEKKSPESSTALATMLVQELELPETYVKRLQGLFCYYVKSAHDIADMAKIKFTLAARDNLRDAFDRLKARTADAMIDDDLPVDRALGRIEGAGALLVRVHLMSRDKIAQETADFKSLIKTGRKTITGK
ncbi:MAG: hypothetical protein V4805_17050 [Pseudomonadota bacterium]